jgi:hypothetical protein
MSYVNLLRPRTLQGACGSHMFWYTFSQGPYVHLRCYRNTDDLREGT